MGEIRADLRWIRENLERLCARIETLESEAIATKAVCRQMRAVTAAMWGAVTSVGMMFGYALVRTLEYWLRGQS